MTWICKKCNRPLTREPIQGMGPVCARAMLGAKPKRVKREDRKSADNRQLPLELEART